ncbi:LPXTG cell wall anchor domain-containing protein [Streptococcus pluranimalium]|uniref:LPXTG cell wall anchor domain-containing protein n=1 Tax=Streptococcus pluranimalium TaxID=82348 RepID=UPI0031386E9C
MKKKDIFKVRKNKAHKNLVSYGKYGVVLGAAVLTLGATSTAFADTELETPVSNSESTPFVERTTDTITDSETLGLTVVASDVDNANENMTSALDSTITTDENSEPPLFPSNEDSNDVNDNSEISLENHGTIALNENATNSETGTDENIISKNVTISNSGSLINFDLKNLFTEEQYERLNNDLAFLQLDFLSSFDGNIMSDETGFWVNHSTPFTNVEDARNEINTESFKQFISGTLVTGKEAILPMTYIDFETNEEIKVNVIVTREDIINPEVVYDELTINYEQTPTVRIIVDDTLQKDSVVIENLGNGSVNIGKQVFKVGYLNGVEISRELIEDTLTDDGNVIIRLSSNYTTDTIRDNVGFNRTASTIPFITYYVDDNEKPEGYFEVIQSGHDGYRRDTLDSGNTSFYIALANFYSRQKALESELGAEIFSYIKTLLNSSQALEKQDAIILRGVAREIEIVEEPVIDEAWVEEEWVEEPTTEPEVISEWVEEPTTEPEVISEWIEDETTEPEVISEWVEEPTTEPEVISEWVEEPTTEPEVISEWIEDETTEPEVISEWVEEPTTEPEVISEWVEEPTTEPEVISEWIEDETTEPEVISEWVEEPTTEPEVISEWVEEPTTEPEVISEWIEDETTEPEVISEWVEEPTTEPEVISEWIEDETTEPEVISEWVEEPTTEPEVISEWIDETPTPTPGQDDSGKDVDGNDSTTGDKVAPHVQLGNKKAQAKAEKAYGAEASVLPETGDTPTAHFALAGLALLGLGVAVGRRKKAD